MMPNLETIQREINALIDGWIAYQEDVGDVAAVDTVIAELEELLTRLKDDHDPISDSA